MRILFLDHQPDDLVLYRQALEAAGCELSIDFVATLEEMMAHVRSNPCDVVLAGCSLGLEHGIAAVPLLKSEGWDIPLILVAGAVGEEDAVECLKEGAADFVLKHRLAHLPSAVLRALTEKRLRVSEKRDIEALARLAAIVESSADAIVSTNLDGIVTTWNAGAQKTYGYTAQEAIGRPMSLIIPPDRLQEAPVLLGKPERRRSPRSGETLRVSRDGRLIPVLASVSPLRNPAGEIVGACEIAHDITERVRMEAQLRNANGRLEEQHRRIRQADRLESLFVANMSHELRTPLNCVIGFAEILYDGRLGPLCDQHKECLGDILSSAQHLLQLVNDMLDLARVESGKLEFNPEPVAPEKLVDEVIQLLETLALSKDIQIEKSVSAELGVVIVDGGRVKQILYNYLSNAVKFTPEGGRVIVRAVPEPPDRFRLEVEDSGIGIRPEDIDGLFTECRQLDDGRGKRYQGTGLGLARTRRIVEAQGGEVGVRSTPGEGSVFHAVLPCMFQQKSVSPEGETPRLLVVESDPLDADLLADLLARAGLGVEIAATEAETLALCRLRRFAAILLSPSRPAAQNAELFQKIRARSGASGVNRNTPIIVVCSEAEKKLGLSFAVGEVLGKPVVCEELLAALGRAGVRPPGARNGASAEARAGKELDA